MSNSLNRHEDSALAQQARKAAFMYGSPLQALRANVARASALGDEAQPGAHHSSITLGTEPSSNHSAGTSGSPLLFYSKMNGNRRFENGVQSPLPQQQQHPNINDGANVTAGHAPGTGKHPCTAQLSIFYAGMVNVYDDVPFDKVRHGFYLLLLEYLCFCINSCFMRVRESSYCFSAMFSSLVHIVRCYCRLRPSCY